MEVPRLRHLRDALHTGNVDVAQAWAAMEADFDDDEEDVRAHPLPSPSPRATASLRSCPPPPMERSPRRSLGAGAGPQPGADPLRLPGQPAQRALGLRPHPMDTAKRTAWPRTSSQRSQMHGTLAFAKVAFHFCYILARASELAKICSSTRQTSDVDSRIRLHAVTHLAHDERQIRGVLTKVPTARWHKFRHLHKRTG